jgi:nucleoside-diphosphate-sugar epimerase
MDLRCDLLEAIVADVDFIFHLAAMPGLVKSWQDFDGYWTCNVLTTQRLLDAVRNVNRDLKRFVLASTSSVYGAHASGNETLPTKPISPYGVTKLAAEHTARAYAEAFTIPIVTLRYFSVYGPRQRPDMGYFKFIQALLANEPVTVFGDGMQARGNTFVNDCVAATIRAMHALPGEVFNVGGGEAVNVWDVLTRIECIARRKFRLRREPARAGDQQQTLADTSKIRTILGWEPLSGFDEGIARQFHWQQAITE